MTVVCEEQVCHLTVAFMKQFSVTAFNSIDQHKDQVCFNHEQNPLLGSPLQTCSWNPTYFCMRRFIELSLEAASMLSLLHTWITSWEARGYISVFFCSTNTSVRSRYNALTAAFKLKIALSNALLYKIFCRQPFSVKTTSKRISAYPHPRASWFFSTQCN